MELKDDRDINLIESLEKDPDYEEFYTLEE